MSNPDAIFKRNDHPGGNAIDPAQIDLHESENSFVTEREEKSSPSGEPRREVYELNCFGIDPNEF